MNERNNSPWMSAWAVVLLCATCFVMLDPKTANELIDTAVHNFDFNSALGLVFVAIAVVNLCALAVRILTWNKE